MPFAKSHRGVSAAGGWASARRNDMDVREKELEPGPSKLSGPGWLREVRAGGKKLLFPRCLERPL